MLGVRPDIDKIPKRLIFNPPGKSPGYAGVTVEV
jgi:hypothetical protein